MSEQNFTLPVGASIHTANIEPVTDVGKLLQQLPGFKVIYDDYCITSFELIGQEGYSAYTNLLTRFLNSDLSNGKRRLNINISFRNAAPSYTIVQYMTGEEFDKFLALLEEHVKSYQK